MAACRVGRFKHFATVRAASLAAVSLALIGAWAWLLLWPAHLSSEYGPPDIQIAQGVALWQLPGLLLLVATLALAVVLRRRQPARITVADLTTRATRTDTRLRQSP
jgi:hypothetical protein